LDEVLTLADSSDIVAIEGQFVQDKRPNRRKYFGPSSLAFLFLLKQRPRSGRFTVGSENFESIHNHSTYAEVEGAGAALPR
jgi:hypothetical protein